MPSLIDRLQPLRRIPIMLRYGGTILLVLASFAALRAAAPALDRSAFLLFMPAVIVSALLFDRGSGFVATALGGVLSSLGPNGSTGGWIAGFPCRSESRNRRFSTRRPRVRRPRTRLLPGAAL
jgi:hypothetical protein